MKHKSVLLQETIKFMNPHPGDVFVDATLGAGGHAEALLNEIGTRGVLVGIDKDEKALALAKERLGGHKNVVFIHGDFKDLKELVQGAGFKSVNGILLDVGVSSMQLDQTERGFSFRGHAKLDMRMDQTAGKTAADVLGTYSEGELTKIFWQYGEDREAKKIAHEIVCERNKGPLIWTDQLSEVVRRVKGGIRNSKFEIRNSKIDPATKVFQALRIEVNKELDALLSALPQMVSLLAPKGRFGVISFHSLEDRIVKRFIEREAKGCVCPPEYPKCICGLHPSLKKITKKVVSATEAEIKENPRSRSAKLRVAEKI